MEQQQETWKLPEAFVARMKAMLGDACDKELFVGLRFPGYEKTKIVDGLPGRLLL